MSPVVMLTVKEKILCCLNSGNPYWDDGDIIVQDRSDYQ